MARGDHIFVTTGLGSLPFEHHGIDMGDGSAIHLAPAAGARVTLRDYSGEFSVRRDSLAKFSRGHQVNTVDYAERHAVEQTIELAESYLGRCGYHLLDNNCEHFATLCVTGKAGSRQIDFGESTVASLASAATKAFWLLTSRAAARVAATAGRAALKPHPLSMLADGVEIAAMTGGCAAGLSADSSRKLARLGGGLTAAGVGCAVAGPVGAAASLAVHCSSTYVAQQFCQVARRILS